MEESHSSLEMVQEWFMALPRQRLIVVGVDEVRPLPGRGSGLALGRMTYVDVIRVVDGHRVQDRFEGVRLEEAADAAAAAGHDVIKRRGNLT